MQRAREEKDARSRSRSPTKRKSHRRSERGLRDIIWRGLIECLPPEHRPYGMRLYRFVRLKNNADYIAFVIRSQVARAEGAAPAAPAIEGALPTKDGRIVRPVAIVHINGASAERAAACVVPLESVSAADREFLLSHRSIREEVAQFADGSGIQKVLRRAVAEMLQVDRAPKVLSGTSVTITEAGITARVTNSYFCNEPVLMPDEVAAFVVFMTADV